MLERLIRIKSVSGEEAEIQKHILDLLTSFDLDPVKINDNVCLIIKGKNDLKTLIFDAHVDTVDPGDVTSWKYDPFLATKVDGKIYGLGASDDKASVSVLLELANKYSKEIPPCNLILAFAAGEEVDGHGTAEIVSYLEDNNLLRGEISAIVCEPTMLKKVGIAHKGNIFIKIITTGVAGHSSKPIDEPNHAVLKMLTIVSNLKHLSEEWGKNYKNEVLGIPTIGLATSISAGNENTPNKFPDKCTAVFDIRTTPEMHDKAMREIRSMTGDAKVEFVYSPVGYAFTDKSEVIVKIFEKIPGTLVTSFSGSSDMPFFTDKGIPAVIFGPGEMKMAHKTDEYCNEKDIDDCLKIFIDVIKLYNINND